MTTKHITGNFYFSITLLIIIAITFLSCQFDRNKNRPERFKYNEYVAKSEIWKDSLSDKGKRLRNNALEKAKSTNTYTILIDSAIVSPEYIPVLNVIGYGIKSKNSVPDQEDTFYFTEDDQKMILNSPDGKDKFEFALNTVLLSFEDKGGFPKEFIDLFERYRKKYKLYGMPRKAYNKEGKLESNISVSHDFTPIFGLLTPKSEKLLDAIYEAREKGISDYFYDGNKVNYMHPFIATPEGYIQHLSGYYRSSDYLPDGYKDRFWKNYDKIVKDRLAVYVLLKDCQKLQEEFDVAYNNMDSQAARTGQTTADLMDFIDNNMKRIDCYD